MSNSKDVGLFVLAPLFAHPTRRSPELMWLTCSPEVILGLNRN